MASSLFFMATDQNPAATPQGLLPRKTHMVGTGGEIRSEPPRSRGRKPGSRAAQNQKKIRQRGMGVAQLERLREQEEKKTMADTSSTMSNPNTRFPIPDPVVIGSFPVLQGLPSYGGPTIFPVVGSSGSGPVAPKINGSFSTRFPGFCCGTGSGQIMIDPAPVYSPETWGFVETSKELSSMPNPNVYSCSDRCEVCFKKKRYDGEAIRSNGGGISTYGMISPMNGHDSPVSMQERNIPSFGYDHRNGYLSRTIASSGSLNFSNPCFNEGSMEMLGSYMMRGNPRNGGPVQIIKEYEFFPGKYENFSGKHENFPGKYGQNAYTTKEIEAPVISVSDCSTNTSAIDLSLKL